MKKYLDFILESSLDNLYLTDDKRFIVNENKFELFVDDTLVSSSRFVIEKPDKYFNEKYITLNVFLYYSPNVVSSPNPYSFSNYFIIYKTLS